MQSVPSDLMELIQVIRCPFNVLNGSAQEYGAR